MKKIAALSIAAALAAGCAEQSAMRMSGDTVRVNVSTAPIYGALEPERRAMVMAAEETLKNGYDKFIIIDGQSGYHANVLGVTGGHASGYYSRGYGSFQASGPSTIAMPRFQTAVTVKMFRAGDPAGSNAIDARQILKSKS
jgi:hypothetical protein